MLSTAIIIPATSALGAQQSSDGSIVTYNREDFERYNPVTLTDIIDRIPGAAGVLEQERRGSGGGERGFGSSGDQVLIDGKRLSAKGNSIRDVLSRTSADDVERIELIRGAADGLEVLTEGLVVNIIMKEGVSASSTFVKTGIMYFSGHQLLPELEVSYKSKAGNLDYTITAEARRRSGKFGREEIFYDLDDNVTGGTIVDGTWRNKHIKLSTNLTYDFGDGQVLNLNGLYQPNDNKNVQFHDDTGTDGDNLHWDIGDKFTEWEIAGDYSRKAGFLGNLKARFVFGREGNSDYVGNRFSGLGDDKYLYVEENFDFDTKEDIIRTSFTKSIFGNQSLEYGVEGAFNSFRQLYSNYDRDAATDPLVLNTLTNIEVRENRYEFFAIHNYTISPKATLQSSLTMESSEIISDTILEDDIVTIDNSFTFWKPRLNFKYDFTTSDQLRLIAEKKVEQLEFFHYFTFFDEIAKELRYGNNDIKPTEAWEFSATYEHRFANDGGNIEVKFYYNDIKNYITRADFTDFRDFGGNPITADQYFALPPNTTLRDDTDFSTKFGNIDSATNYGVELNSNIRLGFLGLPEAQFGVEYEYTNNTFIDDFTKTKRQASWTPRHLVTLSYRHDVSKWGLSYGGEIEFKSGFHHGDINFFWEFDPRNQYEIFIEKQMAGGIKARFEFDKGQEVNTEAVYSRYNDHRRFNDLNRYDRHLIDQPLRFEFTIEGTF
ncbi:TonB-dependent receptor plug domain-containing protein [Pseudemcibacter aquimaris]|uniref:TonB-dependent receptor plug domain-containing protein n=1 Tax=Pseudemcibacter aquimaris TaxID=2857064 RepID=UPI0020113094|nr:TonB-dependent receptor [Pseudemcibacter aquimaris]MCC3859813.1 TonB-dependent receptor plug domain-containing protein [Pseudemcibacter aquimaris]WDU60207.1 TonB-dependent receptor plug domain-containing protein [Pseudemcibacter aquimaris]